VSELPDLEDWGAGTSSPTWMDKCHDNPGYASMMSTPDQEVRRVDLFASRNHMLPCLHL
jgi:hypothetical protein